MGYNRTDEDRGGKGRDAEQDKRRQHSKCTDSK